MDYEDSIFECDIMSVEYYQTGRVDTRFYCGCKVANYGGASYRYPCEDHAPFIRAWEE